MRSHSVKATLVVFINFQSHLVLFTFINLFDDIKHFLIFGYKKVTESIKTRINIEKDLKKFKFFDEILLKLEDTFGVQLTIVVFNYSFSFVLYVSFLEINKDLGSIESKKKKYKLKLPVSLSITRQLL